MEVTEKGPGDLELAVVYCTHGDETAGKKAVEKLLEQDPEFRKGVKFVLANEKACRAGERFIDTDLNRSFPGNPRSDSYEVRLAAKMVGELKDVKVIDMHETRVSPTPFALFTNTDPETVEALQQTGVEKAVEISYTPDCGINHYGGIEVETGPRGTEKSNKTAYKVLKQFLINNEALEGEKELSRPDIFSVYGEEERPGEAWKADVENFTLVEENEAFASRDGDKLEASESFIPVLFSESYPDIFGFKAVRFEKMEEKLFGKGC